MNENTEPAGLPWRVGGNCNLHAYADEPWDVDPSKDRPVATFHRPEDAALAVSRVNAHAALTARAEHAEQLVERYRGAVADMNLVAAECRDERNEARRQRDEAQAERDAAHAELAAANTTDGLDRQAREDGHLLRCVVRDFGLITTEAVRLNARDALDRVLLRARLAQEAPTTKDDDRG